MHNKQTDFWYYSRKERRATLALLIITVLVFLFPAAYDFYRSPDAEEVSEAYRREIAQLDALWQKQPDEAEAVAQAFPFDPNRADRETLTELGLPTATAQTIIRYRERVGPFREVSDLTRIYNLSEADYQRLRPFVRIASKAAVQQEETVRPATEAAVHLTEFDPNTADFDQLLILGFPEKVARTLIRYRDKGGRFRKPDDLSRIYGLSPALFQQLASYIKIDSTRLIAPPQSDTMSTVRIDHHTESTPPLPMVDINQADADAWQQLRGIGPVLSQRIVKFRDKLGGFTSVDQVAETYGLPDSTFQMIRDQLRYSPHTHSIPINQGTAEQLQAHPYIRWQQAKVIAAYRQEHGPFRDLDDLRRVRALDEAFIARIAPYLVFE